MFLIQYSKGKMSLQVAEARLNTLAKGYGGDWYYQAIISRLSPEYRGILDQLNRAIELKEGNL